MERYESPVERQIREAQERGEFDNLPGAGKPLPGIGGSDDPDWWVRGLIRREGLDMTGALPPALALRKEAATFPESLVELCSEQSVREVLQDYNRRVRKDRLRPAEGRFPPFLAKTVDVEEMVGRWRSLRRQASGPAPCAPPAEPSSRTPGTGYKRSRDAFWVRLLRWRPAPDRGDRDA
jgi:hypothetical protein